MPTPSMEDYIEQIYILIHSKGYARVSDIAEALSVHPSSVTKMVQKLDRDEYLVYERYRGLDLTAKGSKIGQRLVFRHDLLEKFLETIGVKEEHIYEDVEGIEHHLSWNAIDRIGDLVAYFEEDPNRIENLRKIQRKNEGIEEPDEATVEADSSTADHVETEADSLEKNGLKETEKAEQPATGNTEKESK